MNRDVIYISDFFADQVLGGGELNDHELLHLLGEKKYHIEKINSHLVTKEFLLDRKDSFFIVSNFSNLNLKSKETILDKINYIIYEHDHKYLKERNPGVYKNFLAPKKDIVNLDMYIKAKAVVCQSSFHKKIIEQNTDLQNLINISGNLWSLNKLDILRKKSKLPKKKFVSILDSDNWHKNRKDAIRYCKAKGMSYKLISNNNSCDFLRFFGENKHFVFFPQTPETLSRICVEARMMNMSVITNSNVGATYEEWFELKGETLIDFMLEKRKEICNSICEMINE